MDDSIRHSEEARLRRRSWPVAKYRLGFEPSDDLSGTTSVEERLRMMWTLASEAWSLTGKPIPDYPRSEAPVVRVVRRAT